MKFIDIHTHISTHSNALSVVNCDNFATKVQGYMSAGIHPWSIASDWEKQFLEIRALAQSEDVVAIGECGIDKINSSAAIELQRKVFAAHAQLAEESHKPLLLHCVKGVDEIVALHRAMRPSQAWIVHGFRGKPRQAVQLIREGLYLSFGEKFNKEALVAVPTDRLLVESDTSSRGIEDIYAAVAAVRGITVEELAAIVLENAKRCGFPF